ncbi:MAG TPA: MFS transporter [Acidimicrobiales bacterium]|nr:MFS transporter [Acidimicrobiales bacterium]
MHLPRVLRASDYRDLLIAESVSALGDWLGTVAFIALVFDITHSATAVGGMLTLRLAPAAVAGPVAARVVARWNPRRTMLAMSAIRALIVAVIPLLYTVWWVFFWAFLLELCSLVFLPARDASILHLLDDEDDLTLANGLILGSSYGTLPLGAGLFALVSGLASGALSFLPGGRFALAFWVDALTFVVGFLLIARITSLRSVHVPGEEEGEEAEPTSFLRALRMPLVRSTLPPVVGVALGLGCLFSLGIDFVKHTLRASDSQFGVLVILFGVGAALGMAVLQIRRPPQPLRVLRPGVTTMGIVLSGMSLAPTLWVAFVGAVLFGGCASYSMVAGMTGVQKALDDDTERQLGFAAFHVGLRISLVLGAIGAGIAGDVIRSNRFPLVGRLDPPRTVLFVCGLVIMFGAWAIRGTIRNVIDQTEADEVARRRSPPAEQPRPALIEPEPGQ